MFWHSDLAEKYNEHPHQADNYPAIIFTKTGDDTYDVTIIDTPGSTVFNDQNDNIETEVEILESSEYDTSTDYRYEIEGEKRSRDFKSEGFAENGFSEQGFDENGELVNSEDSVSSEFDAAMDMQADDDNM